MALRSELSASAGTGASSASSAAGATSSTATELPVLAGRLPADVKVQADELVSTALHEHPVYNLRAPRGDPALRARYMAGRNCALPGCRTRLGIHRVPVVHVGVLHLVFQ
jgi:hypothetical protein